ncbi:hypothetical protein [Geminicoccus roseus]|uniref:hypothetical protein n=1 Tax=Geminicoccus roseus TaxID=404900 RepID=UPI00040E0298|nr:hypothetical protein [Geminicoccus roseus]
MIPIQRLARALAGGLAAMLLLAGCAATTDLGPYSDLKWKIESFYRDHAWEEGARCVLPSMSITQWEVLEETPEKLVVGVRYAWQDDRFGGYDPMLGRNEANICSGFNSRVFTVAKGPAGLQVESMTGEQRR